MGAILKSTCTTHVREGEEEKNIRSSKNKEQEEQTYTTPIMQLFSFKHINFNFVLGKDSTPQSSDASKGQQCLLLEHL